jgi:hypothetical protein
MLDRPGPLPEESYREITETWLAAVDAALAAEIEAGRLAKAGSRAAMMLFLLPLWEKVPERSGGG